MIITIHVYRIRMSLLHIGLISTNSYSTARMGSCVICRSVNSSELLTTLQLRPSEAEQPKVGPIVQWFGLSENSFTIFNLAMKHYMRGQFGLLPIELAEKHFNHRTVLRLPIAQVAAYSSCAHKAFLIAPSNSPTALVYEGIPVLVMFIVIAFYCRWVALNLIFASAYVEKHLGLLIGVGPSHCPFTRQEYAILMALSWRKSTDRNVVPAAGGGVAGTSDESVTFEFEISKYACDNMLSRHVATIRRIIGLFYPQAMPNKGAVRDGVTMFIEGMLSMSAGTPIEILDFSDLFPAPRDRSAVLQLYSRFDSNRCSGFAAVLRRPNNLSQGGFFDVMRNTFIAGETALILCRIPAQVWTTDPHEASGEFFTRTSSVLIWQLYPTFNPTGDIHVVNKSMADDVRTWMSRWYMPFVGCVSYFGNSLSITDDIAGELQDHQRTLNMPGKLRNALLGGIYTMAVLFLTGALLECNRVSYEPGDILPTPSLKETFLSSFNTLATWLRSKLSDYATLPNSGLNPFDLTDSTLGATKPEPSTDPLESGMQAPGKRIDTKFTAGERKSATAKPSKVGPAKGSGFDPVHDGHDSGLDPKATGTVPPATAATASKAGTGAASPTPPVGSGGAGSKPPADTGAAAVPGDPAAGGGSGDGGTAAFNRRSTFGFNGFSSIKSSAMVGRLAGSINVSLRPLQTLHNVHLNASGRGYQPNQSERKPNVLLVNTKKFSFQLIGCRSRIQLVARIKWFNKQSILERMEPISHHTSVWFARRLSFIMTTLATYGVGPCFRMLRPLNIETWPHRFIVPEADVLAESSPEYLFSRPQLLALARMLPARDVQIDQILDGIVAKQFVTRINGFAYQVYLPACPRNEFNPRTQVLNLRSIQTDISHPVICNKNYFVDNARADVPVIMGTQDDLDRLTLIVQTYRTMTKAFDYAIIRVLHSPDTWMFFSSRAVDLRKIALGEASYLNDFDVFFVIVV